MTQPVTTSPAPTPLPTAWARAVANSITRRLRRPWNPSRATRALTSSPRAILSSAAKVEPPHPTVEVLFNQPYALGTVEPHEQLGVPRLIWHLRQTSLIGAIPEPHRDDVEQFVRQSRLRGATPEPFRRAYNRHGMLTLRRNTEHAAAHVAEALLNVANAALVLQLDEEEYQLALSIIEADGAEPLDWYEILEDAIRLELSRQASLASE